jgi:hypothetical protein
MFMYLLKYIRMCLNRLSLPLTGIYLPTYLSTYLSIYVPNNQFDACEPYEGMGVVLGGCCAESTREGKRRRMGVGRVIFSLPTYHVTA